MPPCLWLFQPQSVPGPGVCSPSLSFPFPGPGPASSKRAPDFDRPGSRALPCHLNCGAKGCLWSALRCALIVRHSTNGLLVCGQKRKAIYLLSSPGFLATVEGEPPPWTEQTDPREGIVVRTRLHHTQRTHPGIAGEDTHTHTQSLPALAIALLLGRPQASSSPPLFSPHPPHPRLPGVPSSPLGRLEKATALSQQMARGRSW